jgi:hypothetical protein
MVNEGMPDMLAMFDLFREPNVVFSKPHPSIGKAAERARERSPLSNIAILVS